MKDKRSKVVLVEEYVWMFRIERSLFARAITIFMHATSVAISALSSGVEYVREVVGTFSSSVWKKRSISRPVVVGMLFV